MLLAMANTVKITNYLFQNLIIILYHSQFTSCYLDEAPDPKWPNRAKVALQFVINYEEGAENCLLHGDQASENLLSEIIGVPQYQGERHTNMESLYDFGSR